MKELKCVICGKPAVYESMCMASPVCADCAKKMAKMIMKNKNIADVEDAIEEVYVPIAGDITNIRQK